MEKYFFTFHPSEDAKKVNTVQLAERLDERSEFRSIPRGFAPRNLYSG